MTKNIKKIKNKYKDNEEEQELQMHNLYSKLKNDLSEILSIYTVGEAEIFTSVVDDVSDIITSSFECKEGKCKSNIEFNKKLQNCKNIISSSVDPDMRKIDNADYLCSAVWNLNLENKPDWGCKIPNKKAPGCQNLKTSSRNLLGVRRKSSKIRNENCDWGIRQCKGLSFDECKKKNSAVDQGTGLSMTEEWFEMAKSGEIKENENCEKYEPRPIPMCFNDGADHSLDKPGDRWNYFLDEKKRMGGQQGKIYLKHCKDKKEKKKTKKEMKKWLSERFGKISMEQQMKQMILDSSSEYRDLIDDCMEGKDDIGAEKVVVSVLLLKKKKLQERKP